MTDRSHASENSIGVVKSSYDNIELVLRTYRIPFDIISFKDLENPKIYRRYKSIFFPSGLYDYYEKNLDVQHSGKNINSVSLSKNFFELNVGKFKILFKEFIKNGGSAYFSGYSFKLLNNVYDNMEFFSDFPYMGMEGRVEARFMGDLFNFSLKKKSAFYMGYPGWIAIKEAGDSKYLSTGSFSTPKGEENGPLSFIMKTGPGEIIYTSYYSTLYSDFKRFNVLRIAGNSLLQKTLDISHRQFQTPVTKVADTFINSETSRVYIVNLKPGKNTIYISSEKEPFMFEIYSSDKSLITSTNRFSLKQNYEINSKEETFCAVKIYPSSSKRGSIYSIVSANGSFTTFLQHNWIKFLISAVILIFIIALSKVIYERIK